jgi:hypothetical protein
MSERFLRLRKAAKQANVPVRWVLVKPCLWQEFEFLSKTQSAVPLDRCFASLDPWQQDQILSDLCLRVKSSASSAQNQRQWLWHPVQPEVDQLTRINESERGIWNGQYAGAGQESWRGAGYPISSRSRYLYRRSLTARVTGFSPGKEHHARDSAHRPDSSSPIWKT